MRCSKPGFQGYIFITILFAILLFIASCKASQKVSVDSPDGKYSLTFELTDQNVPVYSVEYQGNKIIAASSLGFEFVEGNASGNDIRIERIQDYTVNTSWKPLYGEKNEYPESYKESFIQLAGEDARFNVRIRAYNEGVAFRYEFGGDNSDLKIKEELTEFALPAKATAWASLRAQSEITKIAVEEITEAVERPLLVQLEDSLFVAIGEAALVDYARMKFVPAPQKPGTLLAKLNSEVVQKASFETPWRFVMAAEQPGQILENNFLLLNLNEPNQIADPSWIKPGKVIREVTLTTRGGMACIDFAVKHNLEYIEFDAGWYGNEYDDASDATTITVDPKRSKGPLDLLKLITYAKSKGIGVILYVNRRALEKQLDEVLPLLKSWGVVGIKYGFVNVGPQEWTSWLHEAIRKAAEHQLMIDVHDEYRPTGYSRTYPNFMTQEGIRGDEESPDNMMVLNTLFTRMIAGAGDHTNCYFASRVDEKMGGHASQLAKAVAIYSPWQFLYWYDRPKGSRSGDEGAGGSKSFIQELPELAFYDALPTVWDDTRVLGGYPGEFGIVARRSGDAWFVGALTGDKGRKMEISLDFLDKGKTYEATIYTDDENSLSPTQVSIETRKVRAGDVISQELPEQKGMAVHIKAL